MMAECGVLLDAGNLNTTPPAAAVLTTPSLSADA